MQAKIEGWASEPTFLVSCLPGIAGRSGAVPEALPLPVRRVAPRPGGAHANGAVPAAEAQPEASRAGRRGGVA
jgi:hypothetical protein